LILGFFDAFKRTRKEVNRANQSQGKDGEEHVRRKYEFNGYKVSRTGRGHDWKAERKDWLTGKKETKYIEVKTTKNENPRLSDLQKKKKRQFGKRYVVEEVEPTPFGPVSKDNMFRSKSPSKYKTKKRPSGLDLGFGLNSNSGTRKRSSSGFDSMFGLSGSSSSKRRKSSGIDSMFGSGGSSSRRKSSSGFDSMLGLGSSSKRRKSSGGIW